MSVPMSLLSTGPSTYRALYNLRGFCCFCFSCSLAHPVATLYLPEASPSLWTFRLLLLLLGSRFSFSVPRILLLGNFWRTNTFKAVCLLNCSSECPPFYSLTSEALVSPNFVLEKAHFTDASVVLSMVDFPLLETSWKSSFRLVSSCQVYIFPVGIRQH